MKVTLLIFSIISFVCFLNAESESWWNRFHNYMCQENVPKNQTIHVPDSVFVCIENKLVNNVLIKHKRECEIINISKFVVFEEFALEYGSELEINNPFDQIGYCSVFFIGIDKEENVVLLALEGADHTFIKTDRAFIKDDLRVLEIIDNKLMIPRHPLMINRLFKRKYSDLIEEEKRKYSDYHEQITTKTKELDILANELKEKDSEIKMLSSQIKNSVDHLIQLLEFKGKLSEQ